MSCATSASQPFAVMPSQSEKPVVHVMPHAPAVHCAEALGAAAHACPHAPHCIASVWSATSQPFCGLVSQSAKPVSHVNAQVSSMQVVVACGRVGHVGHAESDALPSCASVTIGVSVAST